MYSLVCHSLCRSSSSLARPLLVLSANALPVCADDNNGTNPGQFDLATVTGVNPGSGGGVTLIWYADLADISASPLVTLVVDPGTYYATYLGTAPCESAPTAFVVNATPEQLTAYNCDGVAGNNPGGAGNCVDSWSASHSFVLLHRCAFYYR
jgi:hypothetical protein